MDRSKMISQLEDPSEVFDFLVIGGGATGIGIALDASTRGYRVALFEIRNDVILACPVCNFCYGINTDTKALNFNHAGFWSGSNTVPWPCNSICQAPLRLLSQPTGPVWS